MNQWPAHITFKGDYSYSSEPLVSRTTSLSQHVRQRLVQVNRNDKFSVSVFVEESDYEELITFAKNNPDVFLGTYFDCDVNQSGELRIVDGSIKASIEVGSKWRVTFTIEVINRQHAIGEELYALFEEIDPYDLGKIANILANTVNSNP
tara:strand:+ start:29957 stop:30403 length:447 start_codon:yes stop_codon:yes gene_type:complete